MVDIMHIAIAQLVIMALLKALHPSLFYRVSYDLFSEVVDRLNGWMYIMS